MNSRLSTFPTFSPSRTVPPRAASVFPGLGRASMPPLGSPRISIVPGGSISRLPPPLPRPTLPPAVRAARMMRTVRKVAARLARRLPRHIEMEDLVGAGSLGLADAFSRRGSMPGTEFEAFAAFRIRGAMLDELRRVDAMPRRSRRSARRVAVALRTVEQRSGAPATEEEVAAEMGLDLAAYQTLRTKLDASRVPLPLGGAGGSADEDEAMVREVPDAKAETPDALAARAEIAERVQRGLDGLSLRLRTVLTGLYVEGKTLREIGAALGVGESRVCQLHAEALGALRGMVGAEDGEEAAPESGVRGYPRRGPASAQARILRRRGA